MSDIILGVLIMIMMLSTVDDTWDKENIDLSLYLAIPLGYLGGCGFVVCGIMGI